jgi:Protein of unknown function (DUF2889)
MQSQGAGAITRTPLHTRSLNVQVFERSDGWFDVEASLVDVKQIDMHLATGLRLAGEPVHNMQLNLVVDRHLTILQAGSATRAMPYPGQCDQHGNAYAQLVGLNLLQGFRAQIKQRLSGIKGCTHLSELAGVLPTAVIQAFAGHVLDTREGTAEGHPPYQIDKCHALRRDGQVVKTHYPRWFVQANHS